MYRALDIVKIEQTVIHLQERIDLRFPDSGLGKVCLEVLGAVRDADRRCSDLRKPMWWLRFAVLMLIVFIVIALVVTFSSVRFTEEFFEMGTFLEASEALVSEVFLIGAAIFFLVTLELRLKRKRALDALNDYRVLAHIIDMHQLTKDPVRIMRRSPEEILAEDPRAQVLNEVQLQRYLDYCSDLLSILAKTAALYAQNQPDGVVLAAVNEIESLCNGISNKIWQKITNVRMIENAIPVQP